MCENEEIAGKPPKSLRKSVGVRKGSKAAQNLVVTRLSSASATKSTNELNVVNKSVKTKDSKESTLTKTRSLATISPSKIRVHRESSPLKGATKTSK